MSDRPESSAGTVAMIGERLLGRVDELATELTERIRQTERFYGSGGVVPVDDLTASVRDNLVHILSRLAGRPMPGLEPPRATGRRRAEQGVPVAVILHAYRIAGKFIWAAVLTDAAGEDIDVGGLLNAASDLWFIIDELSGEVTDSYRDTVDERVRRDEQTRGAMLDVLLRGDLGDGSRLWDSAATLGLPPRGTFVVVAARAVEPGAESIAHADDTLRRRGIQSAWRVEVDAHIGVLVLTPRMPIERLRSILGSLTDDPVGLSEPYTNLDQTPAALRQARLACLAATPSEHPVRFEQVPVAVLIASAPDAAASLARAILGPVLALPTPECDVLLTTLHVWFTEHGATSSAAERLHVHRNTVRYRLRRIEDLSGRSLVQPTGIAELHLALEAVRILRPQPGASRTGARPLPDPADVRDVV